MNEKIPEPVTNSVNVAGGIITGQTTAAPPQRPPRPPKGTTPRKTAVLSQNHTCGCKAKLDRL